MTTIRITRTSTVPAARVLFAAYDFTERRVEVWPAVRAAHLVVHSADGFTADVTEGTPTGIGTSWERCHYDWSTPGVVVATVTASNVYAAPGSAWQLEATALPGGGCRVDMTWIRRFRRTPRGLLFGTAFRVVGRRLFAGYVRTVIGNLERLGTTQVQSAQAAP